MGLVPDLRSTCVQRQTEICETAIILRVHNQFEANMGLFKISDITCNMAPRLHYRINYNN